MWGKRWYFGKQNYKQLRDKWFDCKALFWHKLFEHGQGTHRPEARAVARWGRAGRRGAPRAPARKARTGSSRSGATRARPGPGARSRAAAASRCSAPSSSSPCTAPWARWTWPAPSTGSGSPRTAWWRRGWRTRAPCCSCSGSWACRWCRRRSSAARCAPPTWSSRAAWQWLDGSACLLSGPSDGQTRCFWYTPCNCEPQIRNSF